MPHIIDIGQLFRYIIRRWYVFALIVAVLMTAGFTTVGAVSESYRAKALIYCPGASSADINTGIQVVKSNFSILGSQKVVAGALKNLSVKIPLNILKKMVIITSRRGSAVFEVTASSSLPQTAIETVNAIADAYIHEISGDSGIVEIYEYASSVKKTVNGKTEQRNRLILIPMISFAGAFVAFVLYILITGRIRSVAEAMICAESDVWSILKKNE